MRLLFDANLSPRLVTRLSDVFPGSRHIQEIGIKSSDEFIWKFAIEHSLVIVTKDDDFRSKALLLAPPGKVILLGLGNCETSEVDSLLRTTQSQIIQFLRSEIETLLVLP